MSIERGCVCWVNLEDAHPPEFGKVRPGLVISNSIQNEILDTVVVIPISSRGHEVWPLRLKVSVPSAKASFAVLPGIRQVKKVRLMELLGRVTDGELRAIEGALRLYLSDG